MLFRMLKSLSHQTNKIAKRVQNAKLMSTLKNKGYPGKFIVRLGAVEKMSGELAKPQPQNQKSVWLMFPFCVSIYYFLELSLLPD